MEWTRFFQKAQKKRLFLFKSASLLAKKGVRIGHRVGYGTGGPPVCVLTLSVFNCGRRRAQTDTRYGGAEFGSASIPCDFSIFLPLRLWPLACKPIRTWET